MSAMANGIMPNEMPKASGDPILTARTPLAQSARRLSNHSHSPNAPSPPVKYAHLGFQSSIEKARRAKAENELSLHKDRMLREKEEEVKQRKIRLERIETAKRREEEANRSGESLGAQLLQTLKQEVTARMESQLREKVQIQAEKDQQAWYQESKELEQDKLRTELKSTLEPAVIEQLTLDKLGEVEQQLIVDLKPEITHMLKDQLKPQLEAETRRELQAKLKDEVLQQLRNELRSSVSESLHHELFDTVENRLREELRPQVFNQLRKEESHNIDNIIRAERSTSIPSENDNNGTLLGEPEAKTPLMEDNAEGTEQPAFSQVDYPSLGSALTHSVASEEKETQDHDASVSKGIIATNSLGDIVFETAKQSIPTPGPEPGMNEHEREQPTTSAHDSSKDVSLKATSSSVEPDDQPSKDNEEIPQQPAFEPIDGARDVQTQPYVDLEEDDSNEEYAEGSEQDAFETIEQEVAKDHRFDPAVHDIKFSSSPAPHIATLKLKRSLSEASDASDEDAPSAKRLRDENFPGDLDTGLDEAPNKSSDIFSSDDESTGSEVEDSEGFQGYGSGEGEVFDNGEDEEEEEEEEDEEEGEEEIDYNWHHPSHTNGDRFEEGQEEYEFGEEQFATAGGRHGVIRFTNTQETAIALDDSDDGAEGETTLVEETSFVAVNKKL